MSGLMSLSCAPNTNFLHDMHATSTCAKASPYQLGNPIPLMEIKLEKLGGGGMHGQTFSLFTFSSLFKDFDCPRSTRLRMLP